MLNYCGDKKLFNTYCDNFTKDKMNNEIVWTYLVARLADKNDNVYEYLTGFQKHIEHSIFLEVQPITPYIKIESNTHLDMALGCIKKRKTVDGKETKSGIELYANELNQVCFVESKYLSDIDIKTKNNIYRNQMARIIDNLLNFNTDNVNYYPVFTLLTPKVFLSSMGFRLYYYKFIEYSNLIKNNTTNIDVFRLNKKKRREAADDSFYMKNLEELKMRWVTFETAISIALEDERYSQYDITLKDDAKNLWEKAIGFLNV